MPAIPAGDLAKLRSSPQTSKLYLVIQQPARIYTPEDLVWYGVIRDDPDADPATSLLVTADAACPAVTIKDGMTVLISRVSHGFWDIADLYAHGDQTMAGGGANEEIYISVSSELAGINDGDYVAVLDEHLYHSRYPRIVGDAGALSWYKDYGWFPDSIGTVDPDDLGLTWAQLGGADAARRQASQPAVPIMGPHVVKFLDPGGSVDIDFDWSDSYAVADGASVDEWVSEGETDHVGGTWNDNVENPAAKTYSTLSGLRGFRVTLDIGTDATDPIDEFTRGVRYVFILRRPGEEQNDDPSDAAPITNFRLDSLSGSYSSGGWTAQVTLFESAASDLLIRPGALAILFSEDTYDGVAGSVGPTTTNLVGRENIVMVGYVGDDLVSVDPETGETTFTILSLAELMKQRENYTVPIENDSAASEWYGTPNLTVDRAAHHYLAWHTNLYLLADCYHTGDTEELAAQDFLDGNTYATIDTFIWDRLFARFLCDRFGRFKMDVDQQLLGPATATTCFTLTGADWVEQISATEVNEGPVSSIELGALHHEGGIVTPLFSIAPAAINRYSGSPQQMSSLVVADQATLNLWSGRYLAYLNNRWPETSIPLAGNWRAMDIWPQEYVVHSLDIHRHAFSAEKAIIRGITLAHDPEAGAMMTTISVESETDGAQGLTVIIPPELPDLPTLPPQWPPIEPPSDGTAEDTGVRIIATDAGVFYTREIGVASPIWYSVNSGFSSADDMYVYCIRRDPYNWWTAGVTSKRLWAATRSGVWRMDDFPYGTWTQVISKAAIYALTGWTEDDPYFLHGMSMNFSIEVENLFLLYTNVPRLTGFPLGAHQVGVVFTILNGAILNYTQLDINRSDLEYGMGKGCVAWAQHSAGQKAYCTTIERGGAGAAQIWRTLNRGTSWTSLESFGLNYKYGVHSTVSVPYVSATHNDRYVYWSDDGSLAASEFFVRKSVDGVTFSDLISTEQYAKVGTSISDQMVWIAAAIPSSKASKYSYDGGSTWFSTPLLSAGTFTTHGSFVNWGLTALVGTLIVGDPGTAPGVIYYWQSGLGDWVDKTGNLTGMGVSIAFDVDRDSSGGA